MEIFGIKFWKEDKKQFLNQLRCDLKLGSKVWIATVNPEFIVEAKRDSKFRKILKDRTTYNVIDGIGLLWAAGVMGSNKSWIKKIAAVLPFFIAGRDRNRLITGVDLMEDLIKIAHEESIPVFFLGSWQPEKVVKVFTKKYMDLKVAGLAVDNLVNVLKTSEYKKAIVFVALGMKKQELWIEENWKSIPSGIVIGVGRSFDYFSGNVYRAPKLVRRLGMEWFFSALLDSKRARRQWKNLPEFIKMVMYEPRN